MKRQRISDIIGTKAEAPFSGSLYAQFDEYFENLLESEHSAEEEAKFRRTYVENEHFERPLRRFIDNRRNSVTAILGLAGVGKSTTLRHLFGVLEAPNFADFDANTLVLPFHFDKTKISNAHENPRLAIQRIITSGALSAVELVSQDREVTISDTELVTFIKKHKPRLLTDLSLPRTATPEQKIDWLRQNHPYPAVAEELKFVCHKSNVNRVIIVFDDLESCDFEEHKEIVLGALKLRECMKSTGQIKRSYKVEVIFSCRPATFERLVRDTTVNGFSVKNPIHFEKPVNLADIVKSRLDYFVEEIGEGAISSTGEFPDTAKDLERWNRSYETLREIIDKISENHGDLLVRLSNLNVRDAQEELLEVLQNSRWYEVAHHNEGQIEIYQDNFRTTDAGIIRALGLKFHNSFYPKSNSPIGNIFFNFRSDDLDLVAIMSLRFLAERSRNGKYRFIRREDLRDALIGCYDEYKVVEYFDEIVSQLDWTGFIRIEEIKSRLSGKIEQMIIAQTRGYEILKLIKESSVPLEILRDNTFVSFGDMGRYDGRGTGTTLLPPGERFLRVGEFIEQIAISEKRMLDRALANMSQERFEELFGDLIISHRCLLGFERSIKRFYYNKDLRRVKAPRSISRKSKDVRQFLRGAGLIKR